jgi:uncharacterized oligopeptide transporter (OPT) family protein
MIDLERLVFPSGVATAAILKAEGSGPIRFKWLMRGIAFSILFALVTGLPNVIPSLPYHFPDDLDLGELLHLPSYVAIVIAVAGGLTAFGGGYITGKAGMILMVGATVAHWILTPIVVTQGWLPPEVVPAKAAAWAFRNAARPLGVGMLLGGSIASVILAAPMLMSALASIQKQRKTAAALGGDMVTQELSPTLLWIGVGVSVVLLTIAGVIGAPDVSPIRIALAALAATVWMWLANIIVSIATGKTDNSPISGMALITIVLIVTLLGREGAMVALVMAVAVCVATSQGSDMMQDLKTGHVVGAVPRRQQITQFAVAWLGPLVSIFTLLILAKKFTFGFDPLTAPQGQAVKAALELFAPPPEAIGSAQQAVAGVIKLRYLIGG